MSEVQTTAPVISNELAKAHFNTNLPAIKYNECLQYLNDLEVSEDNLGTAQEAIKRARGVVKKLDIVKTNLKSPYWAVCKYFDGIYNDLAAPIEEVINKKSVEIQKVGQKIAEDNRKKEVERQRVEHIRSTIDNFIVDQIKAIADTNSTPAIVAIEKLIGSHKANESRYQEFLPEFVAKVDMLIPIIKKQKEHIKELEKAEKDQAAAKAAGDDQKFLDLQDKKELLEHSLAETKNVLQERTVDVVSAPSSAPALAEEILPTVKARRSTFSFKVVDEKKAYAAGMLVCELDKEKAKLVLSGVKADISPNNSKIINGIEYFVEVTY